MVQKAKKIQSDDMLAINEALLLGSLRQHEIAEASDTLSKQLYMLNIKLHTEVDERKQVEETLRASEERFRTLFELGPIGVYSCDASGMIQDFNARAAEMWGRQPTLGDSVERFCGSFKLFRPDGSFMPHEQCPMAAVVSGEIPEVHDAEVIIKRPDGSQIIVIENIRSLRNQLGEITGAINCFYDISARKHAETLARGLASIVESSNDAIISKSLQGIITSWNQGAERLFGYSAQESIGKPITMLMLPEKQGEEREIMDRIGRGERVDNYETIRLRKDGTPVWVSLTVSPLTDGQGKVIGASTIAHDMSERRRADEHRAILVAELNHRAKNSLAMVQAIASQTLSNAPSLDDAKLAFESRLAALARGHDLLTFGNWAGTDLASVVKATVEPHGGGENRFRIDGPFVLLTPATALTFTMALHELCTNAAKYGALLKSEGTVSIVWQVMGNGAESRLHLLWTENGGPIVIPPTRKGFGSRLIEKALAMELSGEVRINYEPSGVVCSIDAPLPMNVVKVN